MFEGYQRIGVHCGALHKSLLQQVHTRTYWVLWSCKKHATRMSLHRIASHQSDQSIHQSHCTDNSSHLFVCLFLFLGLFWFRRTVHGRINEFA